MKIEEFDVQAMVNDIQKENGTISEVYFVACGGSLYSSNYFVNKESASMIGEWIPSKEFVLTPPKRLGKHSLVFICSHGGNTKETVEAADTATEAGAFVITYTSDETSKCASDKYHAIVYKWVDETLQKDKPMCITYAILNELIHRQEPEYKLYDVMKDGIIKCDGIIRKAMKKYQNKADIFLILCIIFFYFKLLISSIVKPVTSDISSIDIFFLSIFLAIFDTPSDLPESYPELYPEL